LWLVIWPIPQAAARWLPDRTAGILRWMHQSAFYRFFIAVSSCCGYFIRFDA
jgi:hypothetical protein